MKAVLLSELWPNSEDKGFITANNVERLRLFYRGKEMMDDSRLEEVGIVTQAKNEEGIVVKVQVGILVHAVKKVTQEREKKNVNEMKNVNC